MIKIRIEYSTGRLEFKDEITKRHDFWIGELKASTVTIHFGKVGTLGHKGAREFRTEKEARDFLSKRLQQKVEEGYKLI